MFSVFSNCSPTIIAIEVLLCLVTNEIQHIPCFHFHLLISSGNVQFDSLLPLGLRKKTTLCCTLELLYGLVICLQIFADYCLYLYLPTEELSANLSTNVI